MPVYKDTNKGTWYTSFHYVDWTGTNRTKIIITLNIDAKICETSVLSLMVKWYSILLRGNGESITVM